MATPLPLEGDGLVENLFHYLWTTDDLGGGPRVSVPPTVIYRGSQPMAWYFTSRKSGRIKRKHRANLTAAHIEHSFTKKKADTDIVAYYLYLPKSGSTSPAIEYYNTEGLCEFLYKRPEIPHSSSSGSQQSAGILQQFSLPKGARNSTLRAIWSPKLCLLERRVNVHAIHDARFSVYERGVTFEEGGGAEALSRPEPVRGSVLPGMVQQLCERVVDHVTRVSYHKFRIARIVLRLQVDADDRVWLLWSSSLRLQPPLASTVPDMVTGEASIRPLDIVSDAKVPIFAFAQGSGGPVSLSSTRSPEVDEEPRSGQTRCASCARVVAHRALLPTTYKAVLAHFQYVLKFLRERANEESHVAIEWPPDERVVQQAGGVGFGILRYLKSVSSSSDDTGLTRVHPGIKAGQARQVLIPPVIRYMHPTLRAEDFARHRQDPIFLHKTVGVCERCCLVYADYGTASLEANGLGVRSSASAPALLRPVREKPKHTKLFDDPQDSLLLTTTSLVSPLASGARTASTKAKPPASAWKPVPTDERQHRRLKTHVRSTLHSLPTAPKLPPRIETFEPDDNDALRLPDGILDDGSPQQQQEREEVFFRALYQQKGAIKDGGHALRHILDAADRLSKAKPHHRLAALGNSTQIGQSQSTGALVGAITELKLARKPGKSPYSIVQRIHADEKRRDGLPKNQVSGNGSSKSPVKPELKAKKSLSKEIQAQDKGRLKKTRIVSSREKRAAAEHRGYLVAALSDAQVQLEHIESLATLVISAPDIEAKEHGAREDTVLLSPRQKEVMAHGKEKEQHDPQLDELEEHEQEHEETILDEQERQVMQQDGDLIQEVGTPFELHGQENRDEGDIQSCEINEALADATLRHEEQRLDEVALFDYEQNEDQLQDHEHESKLQGMELPQWRQDDDQIQLEESEYQELDLDQQVVTRRDEDQDEYDDEYEDPDHEQEHHGLEEQEHHGLEEQDPQQQVYSDDTIKPQEKEPVQNVLEQAQELLTTALSSQSSDNHQACRDHDSSNDSNAHILLTPLPLASATLVDDSSDDAIIAADSVVAAALPLPESTSAATDE